MNNAKRWTQALGLYGTILFLLYGCTYAFINSAGVNESGGTYAPSSEDYQRCHGSTGCENFINDKIAWSPND
jgi:hypothetical protein